jgi:hypothetical protein
LWQAAYLCGEVARSRTKVFEDEKSDGVWSTRAVFHPASSNKRKTITSLGEVSLEAQFPIG